MRLMGVLFVEKNANIQPFYTPSKGLQGNKLSQVRYTVARKKLLEEGRWN
jgi:hypothetical protein